MSVTTQVEKREKSMIEVIVSIVLFLILMAVFISYFMKQQQEIEAAGVKTIANNFFSKVNVVRSQWFMDNKPSVVLLRILGEEKSNKNTDDESGYPKDIAFKKNSAMEKISVNQNGWVDTTDQHLPCQKIWQLVLNTPLEFMQAPVGVVEIKSSTEKQQRICQYSFGNGMFFEYHSLTGKVVQ